MSSFFISMNGEAENSSGKKYELRGSELSGQRKEGYLMDNNANPNPTDGNPTNQEPTPPNATPTPPSFEELLKTNPTFQSEFDRRVTQALQTARQSWEQTQAEELDEAKKLEKMTQAQRDAYLFNKEKEDFEKEKAAFAADQMKVACGNELVKRGLPASFAEYLSADTADATNERINAFEKAFNEAVSQFTNNRMRGTPPKEPKTETEDPFLLGFNS